MAASARFGVVVLALVALVVGGCGGGGSSSGSASGQSTGGIEGYVYGASRSRAAGGISVSRSATPPSGSVALNGATVTLTPTGQSATTADDTDGNGGHFSFAGLTPGGYTLTVTASGYEDVTLVAQVVASLTTQAGTGGETLLQPTEPVQRKWTFLVYMDGANDLEEYGIRNLNQMEGVGSTTDVNIVVQFKRIAGYDSTNGNWTGCRRYLVGKDSSTLSISSAMLEDLGQVDMADPATLQQFLTWGVAQYPAEHYALVLWDHGAGWRSRQLPDGTAASRGILFDDVSGGFMTMGELRTGLTVSGVHLDLIAVDACMMAMVESCYEIMDTCDYIAAAEGSPPSEGYPYDTILAKLAANPAMTPEALGRVFVTDNAAAYAALDVTQTLILTSRLPALAQAVDTFAGALASAYPTNQTAFSTARSRTQAYEYTYYRDLYDFAGNIQTYLSNSTVSAAADAVKQAVAGTNGAVIAEAHNLPDMANSHGISIYLPTSSQSYSGYSDLRLSAEHPKWYSLLRQVTGN